MRTDTFSRVRRIAKYASRRPTPVRTKSKRWDTRGVNTWCHLCRYDKVSPKAFSKSKDVCLSCSMRGDRPRWLNLSGGAVYMWRESARMTMAQFGKLCGWTHARQSKLERQPRCNYQTAVKLAEGLLTAMSLKFDVSRAVHDWPLFALLLSHERIAQVTKELEDL